MARKGGNPAWAAIRNTDTRAASTGATNAADEFLNRVFDALQTARQELGAGASLSAVADWLNHNGYLTRRQKKWTHRQVARCYARLRQRVTAAPHQQAKADKPDLRRRALYPRPSGKAS